MPEEDSPIDLLLLEAEDHMQKSLDVLKRDLANIRSTRASPAMVEHIHVDYYGASTPLIQLAGINAPEPRLLVISPYDKGAMGDIEKAILKSDIGITPQNDGVVIRLFLPELTMERRQELVKQVKHRLEEVRVSIRNIRRDVNDDLKKLKGGGVSEDELKGGQEETQKLTDRYVKKAEDMAQQKEDAILAV
jgi:ribosome recycling factor